MTKRSALLLLGLASAAFAETWMVTTVLDTVDPADGVLSLREAIVAANANVDSTGACRGVNDIVFRLPSTNATAAHGGASTPFYKIRINYQDPEYARAMNFSPRPTTLPHVRCPINLDGYTQPGVTPGSPRIEISGEDLPLVFAGTPDDLRGEEVERTNELLTLEGRLARQLAAGPTQVGCRPADNGCPLRRTSSGSTIRGLLFNHAPQTALALVGADNVTVTGNYFGLDATGENPAPNGRRPEDVRLYSLLLNGASHNIIGTPEERNYFGVTRSNSLMFWPLTGGTGECGQSTAVNAACSRMDIGSSDNLIQSNYFGLNKGGTRSLGGVCVINGSDRRFPGEGGCEEGRSPVNAIYTNGGPHIFVNFYPGNVPLSRNSLRRNQIGGAGPGQGNVFAASWVGVTLRGLDTRIVGNIFGLDRNGIGAAEIAPFSLRAVQILSDSSGTRVDSNIIANSVNFATVTTSTPYGAGGGVNVAGTLTGEGFSYDLPPVVIRANLIGVNARGEHPGKNLLGLPATNAGGGVTVMWALPTRIENNIIAYNGYLGVAPIAARSVTLNPNTANELFFPPRRLVVLSNTIFCNGAAAEGDTCGKGLGIDWSASRVNLPAPAVGDGPTFNADGDRDGPAELQNYPALATAPDGITGKMAGKPNTRYRIQLFASDTASGVCVPVNSAPPPGFVPDRSCATADGPSILAAQSESLLGEIDFRTDANGVAQFALSAPRDRMITATATRLDDDGTPLATSEFSPAVRTGGL